MPDIGIALHYVVSLPVFLYGRIIVSFFLGQPAEMGMAEGNAQVRFYFLIEFQ